MSEARLANHSTSTDNQPAMATQGYQELPLRDYPPQDGSRRMYQQNRFSAGDLYQPPGGSLQRHNSETGRSYDADTQDLKDQLPSRQLGSNPSSGTSLKRKKTKKANRHKSAYATIRLRHGMPVDTEGLAENLLNNPDFTDTPQELQNEDIKELATHLTNKIEIRKRVQSSTMRRDQKRPSWWKQVKYSNALAWKRFKTNSAEVMYSIELWKNHMKKIQGKFGTGVTSYFLFMKWLFIINIPMFILSFSLIVLPQILYRWKQQDPPGYQQNETFSGLELLTGGGWFLNTELYYGYYLSGNIEVIDGMKYDMRYAYISVSAAYYVLTLLIVLSSLTKSYKTNYIDSSGAERFYFVSKALSGWDHNINNPKAAKQRMKSVFKELQEYLVSFRTEKEEKTWSDTCCLFLFRVFTNLIVIGLLAGSGYLVWYISITQSLKTDLAFFSEMALPLSISAINFILPFSFSILASFEGYKNPRTELYMTMLRTIVLNIVTLGGLLIFWLNSLDCSESSEADRTWMDSETECRPCWEDFMGQEIYKLVVMDTIFILGLTFFTEFVRRLLSQFCCKSMGNPEFNIGRNTLYLIYSQSLVWLGTFYSPLLSFIAILKFVIVFYVKRYSVMNNCAPSMKAWRAGRTHTIIMFQLLIAFILCFVVVTYSVALIVPSQVCGPYVGYNTSYEVITELFDDWQNEYNWLKYIIELIVSNEFLACVLIGMIVAVYYMQVAAAGLKEVVNLLQKQIRLEGEDKVFLLKLLQETGGYSPTRRTPKHVYASPQAHMTNTSSRPSDIASPGGVRDSPSGVRRRPPLSMAYPTADHGTAIQVNPQENYNEGYKDQSWDAHRDSLANATPNPTYQTGTGGYGNPDYQDVSPTNRPNLPYPGQHYDIYPSSQGGSTNQNRF